MTDDASGTRIYRDALDAVRGVAAGKSPDELRALLIDELSSRGITRPDEMLVEIYVQRLSRPPRAGADRPRPRRRHGPRRMPPSRLWMIAHLLINARRLPRIIRMARAAEMPQSLPVPGSVRFATQDRSLPPFEVILERAARRWLARNGRALAGMADPGSRIDVWLDSAGRPSEGSPVRVHVRKKLAGVLGPEDGKAFWAPVEAAQLNHSWVMTSGFRTVADGSARFYVYQPRRGDRLSWARAAHQQAGPADAATAAEEMIRRITLARFRPIRGRSYDMAEVDAFLDRVVDALQAGPPLASVMPPESPRFAASRGPGYARDEVDNLLREIRTYSEGPAH